MRLGNHHEAEQAATFIGRGHTFVLSGWTATRGAEHGSTRTTSPSHATSQTRGSTTNQSWTDDDRFHRTTTRGHTRSRDHGTTEEQSRSDAWSDAINWSTTTSTQRVYDFTVEPTTLQNLPDHALLLPRQPQVRAVECDPAIVTLTQPHAAVPDATYIAPPLYQNDAAELPRPDKRE